MQGKGGRCHTVDVVGRDEEAGNCHSLIIPKDDQVGRDIITTLIRTAGISREAFFALLENC
jgi:hypothetical protein